MEMKLKRVREIIEHESAHQALSEIADLLRIEYARSLIPELYPNSGPPPSEKLLRAYSLLNCWNSFAPAHIPFKEWTDVAEMALQVLAEFIDSPEQEYENLDSYDRMMDLRNHRQEELEARPEYRDAFRDLMGT